VISAKEMYTNTDASQTLKKRRCNSIIIIKHERADKTFICVFHVSIVVVVVFDRVYLFDFYFNIERILFFSMIKQTCVCFRTKKKIKKSEEEEEEKDRASNIEIK